MEFRAIANRLGISTYPEALDTLWNSGTRFPVCDRAYLDSLEETYSLFGPLYPTVLEAAKALKQDSDRLHWAETAACYAKHGTLKEARSIPLPESDETLAGDFLGLFLLLPMIPDSVEAYTKKGFRADELRRYLNVYAGSLEVVRSQCGRYGINRMYYSWLCLYGKASIFYHAGFNFEFRTMGPDIICLKNNVTGELAALLCKTEIHASGLALGSAGCEDPEGSWTAVLQEDETAWYGYPAEDGRASPECRRYPKDEWTCILRPGDDVLSIHIPRSTDLSPASVDAAVAGALDLVARTYPEYHVKAIYCHSWLLEPALKDMLGSESRIAAFGSRFLRYPARDSATAVFGFLFPKYHNGLETLPENTRLERLAKARYLSGGYIYAFPGVFFP